MSACGLDFGTSNTTLGIRRDQPRLVRLEGDETTVPSAIFFPPDEQIRIGRAALDAYVDGQPGRLMRGLKSVLGRPLLEETTQVGRTRVTFREVIGRYLGAVKARAEAASGMELTQLVHGRPVHFVDGNPDGDRAAEDALRAIAQEIGFRDLSFEYEPIAAALDYERSVDREEIALIADIGGGTSDFSVVRLHGPSTQAENRKSDILANAGVRIGGTDFDRLLSLSHMMPALGYRSPMKRAGLDVPSSYFHDLATWSNINRLYSPKVRREVDELKREVERPELIERLGVVLAEERGHGLAMEIERAKIELSEGAQTEIALPWLRDDLSVRIDRRSLVTATSGLAECLGQAVAQCVRDAGLGPESIDALFLTGGSTRLPHARAVIAATVPKARIVEGDTFGSVGIGLAIQAGRRYGPARGS